MKATSAVTMDALPHHQLCFSSATRWGGDGRRVFHRRAHDWGST